MIAKPGRIPALRPMLLVLALLMALAPSSFAFADLTPTEAPTVAENSAITAAVAATEAPATEAPTESMTEAPSLDKAAEVDATPDDDPAARTPAPAAAPAAARRDPASTSGDASTSGPYDPNVDGSPSGNGNGGGDNSNKPCAGCVGNADGKNPPGQLPGPENDGDNGYECDGNSGAGRTNPAHSGCQAVVDLDPDIALEKEGPNEAEVGETITYTFGVTNTGDRPLTNVHITDPLIGSGQIAVSPSSLPVGGTGQATAEYTVRAADVTPANEVHNTATVHGTDPDGEAVSDQDSWVIEVPPVVIIPKMHTICHATGQPTKYVVHTSDTDGIMSGHYGSHHHDARDIIPPFVWDRDGKTYQQNWDAASQDIFNAGCVLPDNPDLELDKDGPDQAAVGETITYTFDVTNTGDSTLTDVHVTDPLLGGAAIAVTPSTLAPDAMGVASAQYVVAEADILGEEVPNTATAHGTPPAGPAVSDSDSHVVIVPDITDQDEPDIELDKDGPDVSVLGETITYSFDVTNTGGVTLTDVHVTDPLLGGNPIAVTPSTLRPDESGLATAEYVVDMDDLMHSDPLPGMEATHFVPNTATAHGTPPAGSEVTAVDFHEVVVLLTPASDDPAIDLEKDGPATARVGDRIIYTFTVTNIGDVTLTDVGVRDPLVSRRMLSVTPSTLPPDGIGTASATYRVTPGDGEAGEILNTAVGRGTPPRGPDVVDTDDHTVDVPPPRPAGPKPRIELEKSGPKTAGVAGTITYRFRATNTGNTTLTDVHITDARLGIVDLAVTPSTLLPGDSGTATAAYTVTEADGDRGAIHNTAIVTGTPPGGDPVTDRDNHTTVVRGGPPPPPPPPPPLPATGTGAPAQLAMAGLALLMGLGLLAAARRTTPHGEAWTTTLPARRLSGSDTPPPVHRSSGRAGPTLAF